MTLRCKNSGGIHDSERVPTNNQRRINGLSYDCTGGANFHLFHGQGSESVVER